MTRTYDTLALPRCKDTSLRLPIGMWEYQISTDARRTAELMARGWKVVSQGDQRIVLKYTHREDIQ